MWPTHIWHPSSTSSEPVVGSESESLSLFTPNSPSCVPVRRIRQTRLFSPSSYEWWWKKTRDIFKPFGTPQPQVSAGLPVLESVLFKSRKEKDLMDPPSLWNAVFVIDRWTGSVNPEEQTPARMLRGRSEFFFYLKLMVFGFYAEKLWDLLICPGHPLLHRLRDEDVCFMLWTLCQFFSLRDRRSDCFPSRLLRQLAI